MPSTLPLYHGGSRSWSPHPPPPPPPMWQAFGVTTKITQSTLSSRNLLQHIRNIANRRFRLVSHSVYFGPFLRQCSRNAYFRSVLVLLAPDASPSSYYIVSSSSCAIECVYLVNHQFRLCDSTEGCHGGQPVYSTQRSD